MAAYLGEIMFKYLQKQYCRCRLVAHTSSCSYHRYYDSYDHYRYDKTLLRTSAALRLKGRARACARVSRIVGAHAAMPTLRRTRPPIINPSRMHASTLLMPSWPVFVSVNTYLILIESCSNMPIAVNVQPVASRPLDPSDRVRKKALGYSLFQSKEMQ